MLNLYKELLVTMYLRFGLKVWIVIELVFTFGIWDKEVGANGEACKL